MLCDFTYAPLSSWPGDRTHPAKRRRSPFKASWTTTTDELDREVWHLGARTAIIEIGLDARHIRNDGLPRANAPQPGDPGVVLSLPRSMHGPLRYSCDAFDRWQDNLRAIVLGLESLRRVERYGIAKRGEQYAGWKALPAGAESAQRFSSIEDARHWLAELAGFASEDVDAGRHTDVEIARAALKRAHPDTGGTADDFRDAQSARAVLLA